MIYVYFYFHYITKLSCKALHFRCLSTLEEKCRFAHYLQHLVSVSFFCSGNFIACVFGDLGNIVLIFSCFKF